MEKYKNYSNQSGDIFYEIGEESITLIFDGYGKKTLYHYSTNKMRKQDIDCMCNLAEQGQGLRSFISSSETRHLVIYDYKKTL